MWIAHQDPVQADAVLVATGRKPATEDQGLDAAGVIKIAVDADTDLPLGARLFHMDSQEVMHLPALRESARQVSREEF